MVSNEDNTLMQFWHRLFAATSGAGRPEYCSLDDKTQPDTPLSAVG
jgi:hypothetical protein